jgi:hypothetical protein
MDRDWSVFVHLVDENGIIVAHRDIFPGRGLMPTRKWVAGQTLVDTYVLNIPSTTYSPSSASLEIGLYDYATGDRLLVMTNGNSDSGRSSLSLGAAPILPLAGDTPNPLKIDFDRIIQLAGYSMNRRTLRAGESLVLRLFWRGETQITMNYSVFTHVRGSGESLWASHDSWPQNGAAPTSGWIPGKTVDDEHVLVLKPDTPPGDYDVEIGLYDATGRRLQVRLPDGELTDNFVYLAKIRVEP